MNGAILWVILIKSIKSNIKQMKEDKKAKIMIVHDILNPKPFDDYIPIVTLEKLKKMEALEINKKLKEAENTIKLLKKELASSKVEYQEWEIHHGRFPRYVHHQGRSSKFYIKEKNSPRNVCQVYGGKEKGAQTALIISKVPQMLNMMNQMADIIINEPTTDGTCNLHSSAHETMFLLNTQARELQKLIQ
jgi:hypothetical protein